MTTTTWLALRSRAMVVGGPLYALRDVPEDGPTAWRRKCLGIIWQDSQPDGVWTRCFGIPRGERVSYSDRPAEQPWPFHDRAPSSWSASAIASEALREPAGAAEVLAWRVVESGDDRTIDEALLVIGEPDDKWSLARVWRDVKGLRDDRHWQKSVVFDSPVCGFRTTSHGPTAGEVTKFFNESEWSFFDDGGALLDVGLNDIEWTRLTGHVAPAELLAQVRAARGESVRFASR